MKLSSKLITLAGGVVVAAGISGAAQAGTITLGGITVPTGVIGLAKGTVYADFGVGSASGFGLVDAIGESLSGNPEDSTLKPGSRTYDGGDGIIFPELTYTLGFTISDVQDIGGGEIEVTVSAGEVNYWVDNGLTAFDGSAASAGDGNLWVSATLVAPEILTISLGDGGIATDANGISFDVGTTGAGTGAYNDFFDTDTALLSGHDIFTWSVSATGDFTFDGVNLLGTASGSTDTNFFAIPEPATLGMFGLGLLGLGALNRRRKAA